MCPAINSQAVIGEPRVCFLIDESIPVAALSLAASVRDPESHP